GPVLAGATHRRRAAGLPIESGNGADGGSPSAAATSAGPPPQRLPAATHLPAAGRPEPGPAHGRPTARCTATAVGCTGPTAHPAPAVDGRVPGICWPPAGRGAHRTWPGGARTPDAWAAARRTPGAGPATGGTTTRRAGATARGAATGRAAGSGAAAAFRAVRPRRARRNAGAAARGRTRAHQAASAAQALDGGDWCHRNGRRDSHL